MKQNIFKNIIWILFVCLLSVSCDDKEDETNKTGTIVLGVDKNELLYTKAGVPVTNEILSVAFVNSSGETIKSYADYKQEVQGQRIILPVGNYTVIVSSAKKDEPQWDTPSYYGETEVSITSGKITNASVECSITNTKVTVKYTDSVEKYFSDYEAVVAGKSGELTYIKGENRAGFYFTESLAVTLNLINKNNGLKFQFNKLFPDIKPRYHYILKFDLVPPGEGGDNSGGDIDVTINQTDSTEIECTILIPEFTQLWDIPKTPLLNVTTQLFAEEETNDTSISFAQSDVQDIITKHHVTITTQAGLRNLYLKLSEAFTNDGLPAMFDWMMADDQIKNKLKITGSETGSGNEYIYTLDLAGMANTYLQPYEDASKEYAISLIALDKYHQEIETQLSYSVRPNIPIMAYDLTSQDIWATFAVLKGLCPDGENIRLIYGQKDESEDNWQTISVTPDAEGNVSAMITGLTAGTDYSFKIQATLEDGERQSNTVNFTTSPALVVPYLSFDEWQKNGKTWSLGSTAFWDSGNEGANTLSEVNPTSPEETTVIKNKAARLASTFVGLGSLGKFAAGNIYIGKYKNTVGMSGAELTFGREYSGKPTKLTGYYKYTPGIINYAETGAGLVKGDKDQCHIYIALTTKAYEIDTSDKSTLFTPEDNSVLAYGEIIAGEKVSGEEVNGYKKFEIDLKYKNLTVQPTHILIVASASRYGDYFTGSTSSVLYLDEFELHFDYNPASFVGTGSVLENK